MQRGRLKTRRRRSNISPGIRSNTPSNDIGRKARMNPSKPDGRWDELADLLGLSDQPAPTPAPPPPSAPSQPDRHEVPDYEEDDQPRMDEIVDSADDVISEEDDTVIDESGA